MLLERLILQVALLIPKLLSSFQSISKVLLGKHPWRLRKPANLIFNCRLFACYFWQTGLRVKVFVLFGLHWNLTDVVGGFVWKAMLYSVESFPFFFLVAQSVGWLLQRHIPYVAPAISLGQRTHEEFWVGQRLHLFFWFGQIVLDIQKLLLLLGLFDLTNLVLDELNDKILGLETDRHCIEYLDKFVFLVVP